MSLNYLNTILIVLLLPFIVSSCVEEKAIGYIGFINDQQWVLQFNDCTVYDFDDAERYLWFNRELKKVSCYMFYAEETKQNISVLMQKKIKVYQEPDNTAEFKEGVKPLEFTESDSGWGSFPLVYAFKEAYWYKLKEGWIHLDKVDREFVQFYHGTQDFSGKEEHDYHYNNH